MDTTNMGSSYIFIDANKQMKVWILTREEYNTTWLQFCILGKKKIKDEIIEMLRKTPFGGWQFTKVDKDILPTRTYLVMLNKSISNVYYLYSSQYVVMMNGGCKFWGRSSIVPKQ